MDTPPTSAAALARTLGTTTPRVVRAIDRLGLDARTPSGRIALTPAQARRVRRELGILPAAEGLTRSETLVLAALRSAPLGLASIRAVASRAAISPTSASRALTRLLDQGLVRREKRMIAAGGAREVDLWRANVANPNWSGLDPILNRVEQPGSRRPRPKKVPANLRHLFWNTAPSQLEVDHGGPYIARRLLQTMDIQGLAWGARALRASDWDAGARARNLSPSVRRLAANLAAEAPR